jgi:hypothetical protein
MSRGGSRSEDRRRLNTSSRTKPREELVEKVQYLLFSIQKQSRGSRSSLLGYRLQPMIDVNVIRMNYDVYYHRSGTQVLVADASYLCFV